MHCHRMVLPCCSGSCNNTSRATRRSRTYAEVCTILDASLYYMFVQGFIHQDSHHRPSGPPLCSVCKTTYNTHAATTITYWCYRLEHSLIPKSALGFISSVIDCSQVQRGSKDDVTFDLVSALLKELHEVNFTNDFSCAAELTKNLFNSPYSPHQGALRGQASHKPQHYHATDDLCWIWPPCFQQLRKICSGHAASMWQLKSRQASV